MKHYKVKNYARQAGMTLIELSVVLLILVGLAGLLVPYVGSFTQKTHDSTNSSNLSGLNEAVGRFIAQKNKLPDNLESLTNSADLAAGVGAAGCAGAQTANSVYCGLLDPTVFTASTYTGVASAEGSIPLISLFSAGLHAYHKNDPAAKNKTFGSGTDGAEGLYQPAAYLPATVVPVVHVGPVSAASATVLGITNNTQTAHLALALGGHGGDYDATCYDFIAMGIGDHSELINNTIASAPVHYPEDASKGPTDYYNHYLAIFKVDKSNSGACSSNTEKAKFLGVVMNVPDYAGSHLFGVNQSLAYGYDNGSNK